MTNLFKWYPPLLVKVGEDFMPKSRVSCPIIN